MADADVWVFSYDIDNRWHVAIPTLLVARQHDTMTKNMTVRLPDDLAADAEALARVEGKSVNETIKDALTDAVERRRNDPTFRARVRQIIAEDRELLERLAK
jgi:predicted transcriptional regulator